MSGNIMSQMPKMTMGQNETGKLVEQLVTSLTAITAEKDPATLKEKLAEHMMEIMQHMIGWVGR